MDLKNPIGSEFMPLFLKIKVRRLGKQGDRESPSLILECHSEIRWASFHFTISYASINSTCSRTKLLCFSSPDSHDNHIAISHITSCILQVYSDTSPSKRDASFKLLTISSAWLCASYISTNLSKNPSPIQRFIRSSFQKPLYTVQYQTPQFCQIL